jgi:hypothetical protein
MREQHPLLTAILTAYEYASHDDDSHLEIDIKATNSKYKMIHFRGDNFYLSETDDWLEGHDWGNQRKLELTEVDDLLYLNDLYLTCNK